MEKVVLGLSGGVDSAVSAALLQKQGYEVHGLFLDFGLASPEDAQRVAADLGIFFHSKELAAELEKNVCSYFVEEYIKGRTPNPCIMCNPTVKIKALTVLADEIGAKYIATGHYAKTIPLEDGRRALIKSPSPKDQSYMLCRVPQEMIGRLIFPLGDFLTKDEVREKAAEFGIQIAKKPDSMEVCFIPDNDHGAYIEGRGYAPKPGNFIDETGKILGRHKGIHYYTIGQRKGLGIAATGKLFVHKIDTERNEIVLSLQDIRQKEIIADKAHFILKEFEGETFAADVRVRHSRNTDQAVVSPHGEDSVKIVFTEAVRAPTKGQSAVFYVGDRLVGSGLIV